MEGEYLKKQKNDVKQKVIIIMRCLKGIEWGGSAQALKQMCISMIACKILFKKIDFIQNQALRICSGAVRTTPTVSIEVLHSNIRKICKNKNFK